MSKLYSVKRDEVSDALEEIGFKLPRYHDMEWRFEVQVAESSHLTLLLRMLLSSYSLLFQFIIELCYSVSQTASRSLLKQVAPLVTLDLSLKNPDNPHEIEHVLLQTDPTNLLHMTQELEEALQESRSQHIRRIKQ